MATSPIPVVPQASKLGLAIIANADGTNNKTVFTGNTNGSKITGIIITSTDSVARTIALGVNRSGSNSIIASANVAAGSGNDGVTPGIDGMGATLNPGFPVDNDGQHYLLLQPGDILQTYSSVQVTSGRFVYVTAVASDF